MQNMGIFMDITDMNVLYDALKASMRGSAWKEEPQKYEAHFLEKLGEIQKELREGTYTIDSGSEFILHERGKERFIHGSTMKDRVVRHALCDNVLTPVLNRYIIENNGASQTGKGISFSRSRFEQDLHNYYLKYRTNDGYLVTIDLSKFYDNIQHEKVKEMINPKIDELSQWLLSLILDKFKVDVSYMTDDEYSACMDKIFNFLEYNKLHPRSERTGQKFMEKSVDIGDQASQNIGIFFPTWIDNYAKIVLGLKWYGRYMDDIYFIVHTKEEAHMIIAGIKERAAEIGLFVNSRKTQIKPLSRWFTYLQIRYFLSDTGEVVKKINPKAVTREHRKLKAYKRLLDKNRMLYPDIREAYKSWMGNYARLMSKKQIRNMKKLYKNLFGEAPRWKKQLSRSNSRTEHRSRERSTGTTTSHSRQSQRTCLTTCP